MTINATINHKSLEFDSNDALKLAIGRFGNLRDFTNEQCALVYFQSLFYYFNY